MIDGIKLNISEADRESIRKCERLQALNTWEGHTNHEGEVKCETVKYLGLTLTLYRTKTILQGSLHKFYNNHTGIGHHNANDFSHSQLTETINLLGSIFYFRPSEAIIENLEIGINIPSPKRAKLILDDHLIGFENGRQHSRNDNHEEKGRYLEFRKTSNSSYLYKLYDKGSQYRTHDFLLRWEKKYVRNQGLNTFKIKTLEDLRDQAKVKKLIKNLIDAFTRLMIIDTISPDLQSKELDKFKDFMNAARWKQRTTHCSTQRKRDVDAYNKLITKHGLDSLKNTLITSLRDKADELLECDELHDLDKTENVTNCRLGKGAECNTLQKSRSEVRGYPLEVYELEADHPERKKLRNDKSNTPNNIRRAIEKVLNGPCLFNPCEIITVTPKVKEVLKYWEGTEYDLGDRFGLKG